VTRSIEILRAGPLTTIQDRGRAGFAHLGVPRSGALDQPALALANRLAGNPPEAAGLETTLGGVALRARCACVAVVTGARAAVSVDGRALAWGSPIVLQPGHVLDVGPASDGVRSVVAMSGGIDVEPVLGSRSTDILGGLGPPPVRVGDVFELGASHGEPATLDYAPEPRRPDPLVLGLTLGPRNDWFTDEAISTITTSSYRVSAVSNRVALRLEGPALERRTAEELPSEGLVLGAVQVPADGRPLVFLADHPTTGGYPVIGVIDPDGLALCAQARPGDALQFRPSLYGARP
jgi:biotin-dependent carboxylase-like uncharacterized protein